MTKEEIKEQILNKIPEGTIGQIPKVYLAAIDEAIESVLSGDCTLNGRPISNLKEAVICCAHILNLSIKALQVTIDATRTAAPDAQVTIKYRGESLTFDPLE